jgi:hypothetical protein
MAIPGLVPVNTPAGILMMAPGMAAEVQPYVDPVLGDPNLVAQGALPPPDMPITLPADTQLATAATPEQDRQQLAGKMATVDTSTLVRPGQSGAPMQPQSFGGGPSAPGTDPELERLLANPPSTIATSSTRRTGVPFTGPNREAFDSAQRAALEAEQQSAQAIGAQANAQTAQAQLEAEQAQQMARSEQARRIRQDAIINDARNKREQAWAKIPDQLDPNRWDKTGGPARILGAIGVMLGGISSGITGRENAAKSLMDGIVQEDLANQRAEIELAQQEAQRADNDLQDYLDLYGDPILAEKQLEISANGAFIKELQAYMQSAQGEQIKAAAALGIAERQAEIARLSNEMDGRVGEMVTQSQTNPELETRQWEIGVKTRADQLAAQSDPFHGMDDRSKRDAVARLVVLPSGQKGFAPTEGEGKAMRQAKVALDQYSENVDRLLELAEQGSNLTPTGRGEMEALIQDNAIAIKNIKELGALVGADWGIVDPLSGKGVKDLIAPGAKESIRISKRRMGDELTKKWGTLLAAPFSTDLLNPTGGVQELPGPGD